MQQAQALMHSSMQTALSNGCLAAHTAASLQTRTPASRHHLQAANNSHRRLRHLLMPQQIISAPHTVAPYHLHTTPHQTAGVSQQQQQQQHTTHGLLLLSSSGKQAGCSLITAPRPYPPKEQAVPAPARPLTLGASTAHSAAMSCALMAATYLSTVRCSCSSLCRVM